MVIRDVNAQVEKAIDEIEMRYSKGMIFTIGDLLATKACEGANNFSLYRNRLMSQLSPRRIAQNHGTRNGITSYIKL